MGIRPDDSKKTAERALRGRHALLNAYIDILNRLDGPSRRLPEIRARSAIPTREPHSARTPRRLAYPHEGQVAALTARLRNFSALCSDTAGFSKGASGDSGWLQAHPVG